MVPSLIYPPEVPQQSQQQSGHHSRSKDLFFQHVAEHIYAKFPPLPEAQFYFILSYKVHHLSAGDNFTKQRIAQKSRD